jgi:hypothetical protein
MQRTNPEQWHLMRLSSIASEQQGTTNRSSRHHNRYDVSSPGKGFDNNSRSLSLSLSLIFVPFLGKEKKGKSFFALF